MTITYYWRQLLKTHCTWHCTGVLVILLFDGADSPCQLDVHQMHVLTWLSESYCHCTAIN